MATKLPTSFQNFDWSLHAEVFLRWWLSELAQFVPTRWLDIFARGDEPVLQVVYHPRDTMGANQPYESCNRLTAAVSDGLLVLGVGTYYVQPLDLPLLGWRDLTKAVQFEALRFNPLVRSLTSFDYAVVAHDFINRRVEIDFFFVRQRALDTAISFARASGITLQGVCIDSAGILVRLPRLLPHHGSFVALSVRQRHLVRRICTNTALVCGLMVLLVIRLELAVGTQRARMEHLAAVAHASESARGQFRELMLQIKEVNDEQKKSEGIAVLAELTHLLSDKVWLTHLTTSGTDVQIEGIAQRASSLIAILSKSRLLRQVHFVGPIIKDPRQGLEQFALDITVDEKAGN